MEAIYLAGRMGIQDLFYFYPQIISTPKSIMKFLFTLFIAACSFTLNAQFLLPKVGATISTFEVENSSGMTSKTGLIAGVGYNINISEKFSIQPELNFVQKGSKSKSNYDEFPYAGGYIEYRSTDDARLNYLQVPVMFKLTFGNATKFYVNAGPSIGFGLNGKGTFKNSIYEEDPFGYSYEFSEERDYKILFKKAPDGYEGVDNYVDNRLNLSLQVGGGVTVIEKVNLDVRYGIGLTDLYDDGKSKFRVLQITLGVPIEL